MAAPTQPLPKGVWYEEKRDRYRVRIYRGSSRVIHLSYHETEADALRAWATAKLVQEDTPLKVAAPDLSSAEEQISAFREGLI